MGTLITTNSQRIDSLIGFQGLSLTNFDSNTTSLLYGNVELGGADYNFNGEALITSGLSTGDCYLELIPSGSSITAKWTNASTFEWSDTKGGFYSTVSTSNRVVGGGVATGTVVDEKYFFVSGIKNQLKSFESKFKINNIDSSYLKLTDRSVSELTLYAPTINTTDVLQYVKLYKPATFTFRPNSGSGSGADNLNIDSASSNSIISYLQNIPSFRMFELNAGYYKLTVTSGAAQLSIEFESVFGKENLDNSNNDIFEISSSPF